MEESSKLPLKRIEFSLTKFNDVAIPHHLDLLRQHKANIIKYESLGEYSRVRAEQTHARRVTSQLRALLGELESLRRQVRTDDLNKFDKLTQKARDNTLKAIMDYLETSPVSINRANASELAAAASSAASTDSVGVVAHHTDLGDTRIQLQLEEQEQSLRSREAALRGWVEVQRDVRDLHAAWRALHLAAAAQGTLVEQANDRVELAAVNVEAGRANLAIAEKLRVGAYGAGGALAGALVGGPAGLLAGAKVGAAAAAAGSLLGYLGAKLLGARRHTQIDNENTAPGDKQE